MFGPCQPPYPDRYGTPQEQRNNNNNNNAFVRPHLRPPPLCPYLRPNTLKRNDRLYCLLYTFPTPFTPHTSSHSKCVQRGGGFSSLQFRAPVHQAAQARKKKWPVRFSFLSPIAERWKYLIFSSMFCKLPVQWAAREASRVTCVFLSLPHYWGWLCRVRSLSLDSITLGRRFCSASCSLQMGWCE